MKPSIAVPLGVAGILAAIATAIANANGLFAGHPSLAYRLYGASCVLIAISIVGWAVNARHSDMEAPAQFKITPYELRSVGSMASDIFLRVKIELLHPLKVTVKCYRMELSLTGQIERPEVKSVANKWKLHSGTPSVERSQLMAPLPASLRSGRPVEGWIHFVTKRNQYELQSSRMTFFVHTSRGDGSVEIPCTSEYWNVSRHNFIVGSA